MSSRLRINPAYTIGKSPRSKLFETDEVNDELTHFYVYRDKRWRKDRQITRTTVLQRHD